MTRGRPVIAIDGPSGVGKSTVARSLADKLGFRYINTGAMYRALALAADEAGVDVADNESMKVFCASVRLGFDKAKNAIIINNEDFSAEVKTLKAGSLASVSSANPSVRELLVSFQRSLGEEGGIVMEGRDIGTVVFPDAELKIFLDASHEVRAERRHLELKGVRESRADVSAEIQERDRRDTERKESPLRMAEDAVRIDTGELGIEDVVARALEEAQKAGLIDR
ncbi:MAG: (d)CMP kinase [Deltaproteobacteria bacterium]|nr:(d)CMP kinase [Deltaproteobacteria bacterium]